MTKEARYLQSSSTKRVQIDEGMARIIDNKKVEKIIAECKESGRHPVYWKEISHGYIWGLDDMKDGQGVTLTSKLETGSVENLRDE